MPDFEFSGPETNRKVKSILPKKMAMTATQSIFGQISVNRFFIESGIAKNPQIPLGKKELDHFLPGKME